MKLTNDQARMTSLPAGMVGANDQMNQMSEDLDGAHQEPK